MVSEIWNDGIVWQRVGRELERYNLELGVGFATLDRRDLRQTDLERHWMGVVSGLGVDLDLEQCRMGEICGGRRQRWLVADDGRVYKRCVCDSFSKKKS